MPFQAATALDGFRVKALRRDASDEHSRWISASCSQPVATVAAFMGGRFALAFKTPMAENQFTGRTCDIGWGWASYGMKNLRDLVNV